MRLYVPLRGCQIIVREGTKGDVYEEERLLACTKANADESASMPSRTKEERSETHYTYVALWLKWPRLKVIRSSGPGRTECMADVSWPHHITLAYLPLMSASEMKDMERFMNDLVDDWSTFKPEHRPTALLTSRSFVVGRRACDFTGDDLPHTVYKWQNSDVYTCYRSDFINTEWKRICELIDDGLLALVHEPKVVAMKREVDGDDSITPEFMKVVCAKYYNRDHERVREAKEVEAQSQPKYGKVDTVEVLLRDTAVSKTSEIRSLLHYLRELLVYKFSAHHMEPRKDVGLHDEDSWHVTPQTNGLYAKRQGLDTPDHADYVECQWPFAAYT